MNLLVVNFVHWLGIAPNLLRRETNQLQLTPYGVNCKLVLETLLFVKRHQLDSYHHPTGI